MNKIFLIAHREFLENVKTKGFWIGILSFPVILTLAFVVPTLLEKTKSARKYAVIDESGWLLEAVERQTTAADLGHIFQLVAEKYGEQGEDFEQLPAVLRDLAPTLADIEDQQIPVFAQLLAREPGSAIDRELPSRAVNAIQRHRRSVLAWWAGITPKDAKKLSSTVFKSRYELIEVGDGEQQDRDTLNRMIRDGQLFAYFVIGADPVSGNDSSRYVSNNLTDQDLKRWFGAQAGNQVRTRRLAQERINPDVARWIQEPLVFESQKVGEEGVEEVEARDQLRQWAPVAFVYLLWVSIFTVTQMLLTNTVEEKSNRIIEVLLSSVSPIQLMAGKIAGIAATGLTMVGSWILAFFLGTKLLPLLLSEIPDIDLSVLASDPIYIGSFLVYFLLGYLLYAAIIVGIGSVCNTIKEAQNLMTPIMVFLIVPLIAMVPIGKDPNGTLAQVLSFVPPFTPFVMMNRAAGPPTTLEYVLTTVLLLASVGAALWAGAKVFRIGILLTGKPPKIKEMVKWIKAPVGLVPVRE